jgi:anthranilate/para-aminobenzoate synthase component I
MLLYFKALGAHKYALACFEAIAQDQLFLSPKMRLLVAQERFVNNLGRADSNIPMDQDVEFANRNFKDNFTLVHGEPSERVLNRLSKSVDKVVTVLDSFHKDFGLQRFNTRRQVSADKYEQDVIKLTKAIIEGNIYIEVPSRVMHCTQLHLAAEDPVHTMNLYKLKCWMVDRMASMIDQPYYKY